MSEIPTHSARAGQDVFPPLILHAHGFTLTIIPHVPYRDRVCQLVFFNGTVAIQTEAPVEKHAITTYIECYLSDLQRLYEILEQHLLLLTQHRLFDRRRENDRGYVADYVKAFLTQDAVESLTWVPLELEMQITCLDGEVSFEDNVLTGEFSIRVMVQTPISGKGEQPAHVYTGCEGSVDVQEIAAFCQALRSCVVHYQAL